MCGILPPAQRPLRSCPKIPDQRFGFVGRMAVKNSKLCWSPYRPSTVRVSNLTLSRANLGIQQEVARIPHCTMTAWCGVRQA